MFKLDFKKKKKNIYPIITKLINRQTYIPITQ